MHLPTMNMTRKSVANIKFWHLCVQPAVAPNSLESLFHFLILLLEAGPKNAIACNSLLENLCGSGLMQYPRPRQPTCNRAGTNASEASKSFTNDVLTCSLP